MYFAGIQHIITGHGCGPDGCQAGGLVQQSDRDSEEHRVHVLYDVDEWEPDPFVQHHDDCVWHLSATCGDHELQTEYARPAQPCSTVRKGIHMYTVLQCILFNHLLLLI